MILSKIWSLGATALKLVYRSQIGRPQAIQNTVVQSIELQGNRCGTGKCRQNSKGTGIAKVAGAAPLMTVQLTDNTGVAPVKGVPPAKVMAPWSGGTGIAKGPRP